MKYFIDTEFMERPCTIDLISIGIAADDGRTFYAEVSDCDLAKANPFVAEKVIPSLQFDRDQAPFITQFTNQCVEVYAPKHSLADFIRQFIGPETPEFWGYYCDYDWVVFCWLFGAMVDLPKGWPMYCKDLRQLADDLDNPVHNIPDMGYHNALSDAQWAMKYHDFLMSTISRGVY